VDAGPAAEQVLRNASLTVLPGVLSAREAVSHLVDWQGTRGVLRRSPVPPAPHLREGLAADVSWLHEFLIKLAGLGFPAPCPLPCFGGRSWLLANDQLWQVVSYIPGHEVGTRSEPPMEQIGELLARYHSAACRLTMTTQRPGVVPLGDVPAMLLSARLRSWCRDPGQAHEIRRLALRLAGDLEAAALPENAWVVIHGDFTNHNVIADGSPARPVGVIDFQRAHFQAPVTDIAAGLWRSGRPRDDASVLDLSRVHRFVFGYSRTGRLSPSEAGALPAYLYGRGLQMIARRSLQGHGDAGMLAEVRWISANAAAIADTAVAALP
jgi:Ser/Thr protein kinase RdoA (MazF antagonist)